MNNYFTLIYLNSEIKEKIVGGMYCFAISPHRDVLEIYIENLKQKFRLIFSANRSETTLFLDRYRPPKKSNVMEFFNRLEGRKITGTSLASEDRLWYLHLEGDLSLQFKLYGAPNAYLTDGDRVLDAFKNPDEARGEEPPRPMQPERDPEPRMKAKPKNRLTGLNPLLPRNLLNHLIEQHGVAEMDAEETRGFVDRITEAMREDPVPRVLRTGDLTLWPESILDIPTDESFETVNDAVRHAYRNRVHLRRLHNMKEKLVQFLDRMETRKSSLLNQLEQADENLERADEYEKFGHLLMTHAHESIGRGTETLTVSDLYENHQPVEIPVDPDGSVADNAERYYDKAKSARTAFREAKRRLPKVREELETVRRFQKEVSGIDRLPEMEQWEKDHSETLHKLGFGVDDQAQAVSPFRKLNVGKYEVWIGKSAKSNDELTSLAHKEDIWLHARGVSGSHVVIRMGNTKEYPPKNVILQACGFAAWYSKAKGMRSAPVIYTKRKYVRKPKGAGPGAVVVEKEQVEMVPPTEPSKQHHD